MIIWSDSVLYHRLRLTRSTMNTTGRSIDGLESCQQETWLHFKIAASSLSSLHDGGSFGVGDKLCLVASLDVHLCYRLLCILVDSIKVRKASITFSNRLCSGVVKHRFNGIYHLVYIFFTRNYAIFLSFYTTMLRFLYAVNATVSLVFFRFFSMGDSIIKFGLNIKFWDTHYKL